MRKILPSVSVAAVLVSSLASANEKVIRLSNSDENWVMPGKDYSSDNYSKMTQIDATNVEQLRSAWSFSTGVLNGHEGTPLVVNGKLSSRAR
jgi:methanol dehydrogenase (cytochrome c) subunit 1